MMKTISRGRLALWAGVLAHVAPAVGRLQAAGGDTVTAVIGVLCSAALVGAALWRAVR